MNAAVVARAYERAGEPSRARYPDESGYAERDGVRLFWELYGTGDPTVVFINPAPFIEHYDYRQEGRLP